MILTKRIETQQQTKREKKSNASVLGETCPRLTFVQQELLRKSVCVFKYVCATTK